MASSIESTHFRIPLTCGYSLFARQEEKRCTDDNDNNDGVILLVVHGGPGLADHTESFSGFRQALHHHGTTTTMTASCRSVFFYDQLGCGSSDKPTDFDYSLQYYTEELHQVIEFCLQRGQEKVSPTNVCLLGHSWGGQVVLEYLFQKHQQQQQQNYKENGNSCQARQPRQAAVKCAIISNTPLDEDTYERKQQQLRSTLDEATRQFLQDDDRRQAMDGSVGSAIYSKLIGTSDTAVTGELKGWSVRERINDLDTPCLFISGTFDTIPFEEYEQIAVAADTCHRVCILEGGGHGPFFGETAVLYFQTINKFLQRIIPRNC